ncbi:MAG: heterodisulfide reductase, partial [Magnetococcales bacterium]|nr:heterodisulfide reductase [Magnetococcales bacterium]
VAERTLGQEIDMPEVNFAQLLGLSLGLDAKSLGMDRLHVSAQPVLSAHGVI